MKINATTLQNLNANESYYLSSTTGEIKQAGWIQKLKCFFGIGDGRAKAAALAERVKEALLADGAIESEAELDGEIAGLNTNRSLSGSDLARIAMRFRTSHAEAVGRADARRSAEAIAERLADTWVRDHHIHPAPVSVGYVKRLAVYAASPVIANAAQYGDDESLTRAMRSKMDLLLTVLREVPAFSELNKLGYPSEKKLTMPDGSTFTASTPRLKLDDLHFRLILACMTDGDGDVRLHDCYTALLNFPEGDLKALASKIEDIPLMDATRPGAVVSFKNAFAEVYNNYIVADECLYRGTLPTRVQKELHRFLDKIRTIYGEGSFSQKTSLFDLVKRTSFTNAIQPFINAANAEHRLIRPTEVVSALESLREESRLNIAAKFLRNKADEFLAAEGGGEAHPTFGKDLFKRNTALRDDLLSCKSPEDVDAFMLKHEGAIRDHLQFEKSVLAERERLPDRAAVKIAEALGMDVDEVKNATNFDRLDSKVGDKVGEILDGTYPGSLEKGFDIVAAFNADVDKFVKTRVDLVNEVNDAKGVSDAVKAKWKALILKSDKPDDFHASKFTKLLNMRGDEMRAGLESVLEVGLTAGERAKRFSEYFGSLNAEFVYLFGEEEWIDVGAAGHDTAFRMLLHAVADKVPDFNERINAVRKELTEIPGVEFAKYMDLGVGSDIRDYLCHDIAPLPEE